MASHSGSSRRSLSFSGSPLHAKKKSTELDGGDMDNARKSLSRSPITSKGERTVKGLRLSKALTVPENTTIYEACRRMAARRVDALLLTDSNALLCGILTDRDVATRVISQGLNLEETPVSKVMTKNPVFVLSDMLAVEALLKMVQGKFRHLPVVENGEVVALLDIAKCLYDAIVRMERTAEKGKAIVAAVEGIERNWGSTTSGPTTFIETLREKLFRPSLSTIIPENSKVLKVPSTDTVLTVSKKMFEFHSSAAVVMVDNKLRGIITSKDILMRVVAQNLPPDSTILEKVMTVNPESATVDTPIVDALHIMHDGKFLHLPVVDRDGEVAAIIDVINITQASVATVGSTVGNNNESASTMMQKFWDTAMELPPQDYDDDTRSEEGSGRLASDVETGKFSPPMSTFAFKIQDKKGRMHRFMCEPQSLMDLIATVLHRIGEDNDRENLPQIMYEDEDHDQVILVTDSDLLAAVEHARSMGWKVLKLRLDFSVESSRHNALGSNNIDYAKSDAWAAAYSAIAAGVAVAAGIVALAYLKRYEK